MLQQHDPSAEAAFVEAFLRGDPQARRRFAERLSRVPKILAMRNARIGHPLSEHELADVAQETMVAAIRKLPDYRPIAPLEHWVYGICCLQLRMMLRRRQRHRSRTTVLSDQQPDDAPSAETALADRHEVEHLLERMGGTEADLVRLKHLESLTFEEIGERLGMSANTAKTRYYRGTRRLRRLLSESDLGDEATAQDANIKLPGKEKRA